MRHQFLLLFLPVFVAVGCVSENSEDNSEPVKEPLNLKRHAATAPSSGGGLDFDEDSSARKANAKTPPRVLNFQEVVSKMTYPEAAREKGVEGQVMVRVFVDESGAYVKHEVKQSPDPLLTQAVNPIVKQLRFHPASKDGRAVAAWVMLPITLKADN